MEGRRFFTTVLVVIFLAGLFLISVPTGRVVADNGPHGGYTPTTDACAGCHRTHTAAAPRLLIDAVPNLCFSCHGNSGNGADTNVLDGIYLERDLETESPVEGVDNRGLRGGGFINALVDTDRDGTAVPTAVTSNHLNDGSMGTAWGNGIIGSGPGLSIALSCTSCHDPHGGDTYRILRPIPSDSGAAAPVAVADETNKTYTVGDANNDYMIENYGTTGSSLASWCSQCHTRYLASSGSGHTDSGDPIFTYRHATTSVNCVRCHVAHGSSATMGENSGSVPWPDSATAPNGDARSSLLRMDNRGVCAFCHLGADGSVGGGACDSCHGAPPTSGAHLKHAGSGAVDYGLTGSFATATDYQFGCGECHPTDTSQHMNGIVNVDLSPAGAPVGSLKEQNGAGAAFTGGTCGEVYCHSGIQVTSGPVGLPLVDGGGNAILDSHGNLTYDPYTVTETRVFQTTPAWNGGLITTCDACHNFPLTTTYPDVEAGVGQSHQWIDDFGYGNLHAWNMSFDPLSCRTCHYGEIVDANTWTRDINDVTYYDPAALDSRVAHANGERDVVFDTVNSIVYNTSSGPVSYDLSSAVYDPAANSCANVACHLNQTYVEWGSPYRWQLSGECDLCHRMFLPLPTNSLFSGLQGFGQGSGDTHSAENMAGKTCASCHVEAHGKRE